MDTTIYATIRQESKYHDQQPIRDGKIMPFSVKFKLNSHDVYIIEGNPENGGCYMLFDVDLWFLCGDGTYEEIPMHNSPCRNKRDDMWHPNK